MAKITITIEDQSDGSVKITADPSFEKMVQKMKASLDGKSDWSSAYDYAMYALTSVTKKSRETGRQKITPEGMT